MVLKNADELENDDNHKNEDNLRNEDNLNNENNLKNEDDLKNKDSHCWNAHHAGHFFYCRFSEFESHPDNPISFEPYGTFYVIQSNMFEGQNDIIP